MSSYKTAAVNLQHGMRVSCEGFDQTTEAFIVEVKDRDGHFVEVLFEFPHAPARWVSMSADAELTVHSERLIVHTAGDGSDLDSDLATASEMLRQAFEMFFTCGANNGLDDAVVAGGVTDAAFAALERNCGAGEARQMLRLIAETNAEVWS